MADSGETITGQEVLARCLAQQGVEYMFGIVGKNTVHIPHHGHKVGIKYVGTRNEHAACHAANAIGYMTGRPAVCITIQGPGIYAALIGMKNALENGWPLIVISGSVVQDKEKKNAFEEADQAAAALPYSKFSCRPPNVQRIPYFVEKAVRTAMYGRPGPCFLEIPTDLIDAVVPLSSITDWPVKCPAPPRQLSAPEDVSRAVDVLVGAARPLVIVGKGAQFGHAEKNVDALIHQYGLPFLPTPMGRGLVSDEDDLCFAQARVVALQEADVVLLLGVRLNWIFHYGLPPRFDANVKFLQIDFSAEELHNNHPAEVALHGDVNSVVGQMLDDLKARHKGFKVKADGAWLTRLRNDLKFGAEQLHKIVTETAHPLNYFNAMNLVQSYLPKKSFLVCEGSHVTDTATLACLKSYEPRHRMDTGSFGAVGVGSGYAMAAAIWCRQYEPDARVFCIQGDSTFGFGGIELETINRYDLPVIFIVINNGGILYGPSEEAYKEAKKDPLLTLPSNALTHKARYDKMMEAFGGHGFGVETLDELRKAMEVSLKSKDRPSLINIFIDPGYTPKVKEFRRLTYKCFKCHTPREYGESAEALAVLRKH